MLKMNTISKDIRSELGIKLFTLNKDTYISNFAGINVIVMNTDHVTFNGGVKVACCLAQESKSFASIKELGTIDYAFLVGKKFIKYPIKTQLSLLLTEGLSSIDTLSQLPALRKLLSKVDEAFGNGYGEFLSANYNVSLFRPDVIKNDLYRYAIIGSKRIVKKADNIYDGVYQKSIKKDINRAIDITKEFRNDVIKENVLVRTDPRSNVPSGNMPEINQINTILDEVEDFIKTSPQVTEASAIQDIIDSANEANEIMKEGKKREAEQEKNKSNPRSVKGNNDIKAQSSDTTF